MEGFYSKSRWNKKTGTTTSQMGERCGQRHERTRSPQLERRGSESRGVEARDYGGQDPSWVVVPTSSSKLLIIISIELL